MSLGPRAVPVDLESLEPQGHRSCSFPSARFAFVAQIMHDGTPFLTQTLAMADTRRARGPSLVGAYLRHSMAPALRRRGFPQAEAITHWPAIVGQELARHCCPERLSYAQGTRNGGTLHVRAAGSIAVELQHLEPQVVERINRYFGFHAVARLALLQAPLPAPPRARASPSGRCLSPAEQAALSRTTAEITDPGLRLALTKLGHRIAAADPAAAGQAGR